MSTVSATIKINDAFSGALNRLSAGLSKGQSGFNKLKSTLSGGSAFSNATRQSDGLFKSMLGANLVGGAVSKGMSMATAGIQSMVGELNEASKSWQTFEGNMHELGKSPAEILSAKKDMQKFAQQTIYSASDMSSTYAQLAAVGTKNTAKLVKGFGGLAAASDNPAQAMKTLSEQATQMAAKPKVQWQDFKLMLEQSPAGMAAVAKTMHTNTTQLIKDIQDGKVKTQDFLDAVAKTGTNANFSKMATQYKTIGQAVDGLKETLANNLQPTFDKVGKVGIKAVEKITDSLSDINFDALGDSLAGGLEKIDVDSIINGIRTSLAVIKPIFDDLKLGVTDFFNAFNDTGAMEDVKGALLDVAGAAKNITNNLNNSSGGDSIFTSLGKLSGGALSSVAGALSAIAKITGKLDPDSIKQLGTAFMILKAGTKGLMIMAAVKALQQISNLDPGTLKQIASAIEKLAMAFMILKGIKMVGGALKGAVGGLVDLIGAFIIFKNGAKKFGTGIKEIFGAFKNGGFKNGIKSILDAFKNKKMETPKMPETPKTPSTPKTPETPKPGGILQNAAAYLKLAGALLMVGGAVTLVGAGFKLMTDSATQLASAGGGAIAVFFGMFAAIALLAGVVKLLGPAFIASAAGFLVFEGALLVIGAAIFIASAGIALLATQLPLLSQYGTSAAVGILALAGAIAVFGIGAIVGAVGVILLGASLLVLAVGMTVAAVGAILLGAGLLIVGVASTVAAVGMLLFGVGLTLVAAMALVASVGILLLGVGLVLVGATSLVASVGILLLGVGLTLVAAVALVAGTGLMLVGAGLMLVGIGASTAAPGVTAIAQALSQLVDSISGGISKILNSIANVISSIGNSARNAGEGMMLMADGLKTISSIGAWGIAKSLTAVAVGAGKLASLGSGLSSAGNGMEQLASSARTAVSSLNQLKSIKILAPKVETPKVPTPQMPGTLKTIPAPRVGTPHVPTPKMPNTLSTIPAPKVGVPHVPTPKMPSGLATIPAPKVGTPTIPTPKMSGTLSTIPAPKVGVPVVPTPRMPTSLSSIPAPKVGTPVVPTPKYLGSIPTIPAPRVGTPTVPTPIMPMGLPMIPAPKVGTPIIPMPQVPTSLPSIPAPHVGTPNMSGVISAVASGMAAAAAAARAGGAQLVAAVRGSVAQAVAAGRAGAGAKVHSPSRVWMTIGDFIGQGLANGITNTTSLVTKASSDIIDNASDITPSINSPVFNSDNVPGGKGVTSSVGSSVVTSSTPLTSGGLTSNSTDNSIQINFTDGAIVINRTGNADYDADELLKRLEQKIIEAKNKSLY